MLHILYTHYCAIANAMLYRVRKKSIEETEKVLVIFCHDIHYSLSL